jgi:hypothetical protein
MNPLDNLFLTVLLDVARRRYDGHLTIMRFTTNWRVCFGTPEDRDDIEAMSEGDTFVEAAGRALWKAALYVDTRRAKTIQDLLATTKAAPKNNDPLFDQDPF